MKDNTWCHYNNKVLTFCYLSWWIERRLEHKNDLKLSRIEPLTDQPKLKQNCNINKTQNTTLIGSYVLKASPVKCQLLTLDCPSINTWWTSWSILRRHWSSSCVNTWLTLGQQLVDSQQNVKHVCENYFTLDWLSTKLLIECQQRCSLSI